jgi:MarR family transcriptional regulator, lower aerobic nicotinate degradation pathway regulator
MSEDSKRQSTREQNPSDMTVILDSIRAIVKALRDSGRDTEQRLGITSAQLYVLQELREKPASINELAARTYTHQSSVSMVVARLVENRLVTRSAARNDARKVSISLTAAGRALVRKAPDAAQTRIMSALRSMSRSDLQSLSTGLESLTDIMAEQQKSGTRKSRLSVTA